MKPFLLYTALFIAGTTLIASGSHIVGTGVVAISLVIGIYSEMRGAEE